MIAPNVDGVRIFDLALTDRPREDQSSSLVWGTLEMHLVRLSSDALVPQARDQSHTGAYERLLPQSAVPALHVDVGSFLLFLQRGLVLRRCVVPKLL